MRSRVPQMIGIIVLVSGLTALGVTWLRDGEFSGLREKFRMQELQTAQVLNMYKTPAKCKSGYCHDRKCHSNNIDDELHRMDHDSDAHRKQRKRWKDQLLFKVLLRSISFKGRIVKDAVLFL